MKKILITGANSYIGTSFEQYVNENFPKDYTVDTVDTIDGSWRNMSFSGYDVIFHVAGIVHKKEYKKNAELYYKVNRDLTFDIAKKAKNDAVKQFIFLSTMNVYGMITGTISKSTIPHPNTNYGKSKLQAEERISTLIDCNFNVCILRPPVVYGEGCKGNYTALKKLSLKTPVFPNIKNKRSAINISTLCEYTRCYIDSSASGVLYPQDSTYICTSDIVKKFAAEAGHMIIMTRMFNWMIYILLFCKVKIISKVFGDLVYKFTE